MTDKLREAAQQALGALETKGEHHPRVYRAIEALRAALMSVPDGAEQPAEPVAIVTALSVHADGVVRASLNCELPLMMELYAAPQPKAEQPAEQQCEYCKRGLKAGICYCKPAEPEPVAWGNFKEDGTLVGLSQHPEDHANWVGRKPLYTAPQPAKHPFLVRDIAELIGSTVPAVCNALEDMGIEPRRSTNAAVTPDEALAVARRLAQPTKRKPLTDEEIDALELPPSGTATVRDLVRLIERAHGIGGGA